MLSKNKFKKCKKKKEKKFISTAVSKANLLNSVCFMSSSVVALFTPLLIFMYFYVCFIYNTMLTQALRINGAGGFNGSFYNLMCTG